MTASSLGAIDRLDAALIELLAAEPRVGMLEASRRLGVARGTVQARLDRLQDRGVITGYGPTVDPAALGYEVTAFITLEIRQAGGHDPVATRLAAIPEVLEVHTITGPGDMLCRVVAGTNACSAPPPRFRWPRRFPTGFSRWSTPPRRVRPGYYLVLTCPSKAECAV
jgi:DNA-binding Lrp family transcriptional regulator